MKKLDKTITRNFKNVLGRFALWTSTVYILLSFSENLKKSIKSIKKLDDSITHIGKK